MLRAIRYWFLRRSPRTYQPVVLITGCGSGLGYALAARLLRCPEYRVVVTARRGRSLARVRSSFPESDRCLPLPLDVTDPDSRDLTLAAVEERWGGVDILVNNAGISYRAVVEHMSDEDELRQMGTNYLGPLALVRRVLPGMRAKGRGKIINVSSVSGMLAMPTMASYTASKHALEGASEALWYELKPFGVNVTLVQPGFVHSASFQNVYYSARSRPGGSDGPYRDYYESMTPFVARLMNWSRATPEAIAERILRIIRKENPPLWVRVTADAHVFYFLRRFLPRPLLLRLLFACLPHARHWAERDTHRRGRKAA